MIVKSFEINNFRNLAGAAIDLDNRINLVVGNNASGKTSVLEALFFLLSGRSFRSIKESVLISEGFEYSRLRGIVEDKEGEHKIEIGFDRKGKKRLYIDEIREQKISRLLEVSAVISVVPDDIELTAGSPESRRRFLDSLLSHCYPSYLSSLFYYNKVLKQKNAYLKDDTVDKKQLFVWNKQLIDYAVEIVNRRLQFLDYLTERGEEIYGEFFGAQEVSYSYRSNYPVENQSEIASGLMEQLSDKLQREIRTRQSIVGPHRDDIDIKVKGISLRDYGSRGQQRCAMLAMKFSAFEFMEKIRGEKPLLILDEAISELDGIRSVNLLEISKSIGQAVMASAHEFDIPDDLGKIKKFEITNGVISAVD